MAGVIKTHMSSLGKGIWNFASDFSHVSCKAAQLKQGQALQQDRSIFIRLQVITARIICTLVMLEPPYPLTCLSAAGLKDT